MNRLETVVEFLRGETTLVLSTVSAHGAPLSAPLFYLLEDGPRLYWFSSRRSAHSRNLKLNPAAAVAVHHPTAIWREIRGVQMRGTAALVADRAQRLAVQEGYAARFQLGTLFDAAISQSGLYVFDPSWIRYIDNTKSFGYKFEIWQTAP